MHPSAKFASWWIFLIVALSALFLSTISPSTYWDDCGEFVVAAHSLGILHAPGHPLFPLAGRCAAFLGSGIDAVFRINLLSTFAAVAGVLFFYALGIRIARVAAGGEEDEEAEGTASGVTAPGSLGWSIPSMCMLTLLLATRGFIWGYATQAEIYSFLLLFAYAILYVAVRDMSGASVRNRFALYGFLFGLGVTANPMVLFMLPVAAGTTIGIGGIGVPRKGVLHFLLFFLLGLSIYLYCPLRSAFAPPVNWGETHRFHNFLALITVRDFSGSITSLTYMAATSFMGALKVTSGVFLSQFPPILIPFSFIGIVALMKRSRICAITVAAACCGNFIFASVVGGGLVHDAYLIPSLSICFALSAAGMAVMPIVVARRYRFPRRITSTVVTLLLGCTVILSLRGGLPLYNRHEFRDAEIYGKLLLDGLEKKSVLCTENTLDWFSTMAVQHFRQWREDVFVLYMPLLERQWYRESLGRNSSLEGTGIHDIYADRRSDPLEILFRLKGANPDKAWYYTPRKHIRIPPDSLALDGPVFRILSSHEMGKNAAGDQGERDARMTSLRALARDATDLNTKKRVALIHQYRGSFMYSKGVLTEALSEYRAIIDLLPGSPDAWYNLGLIADRTGDPVEAVAALEQALRLDPSNIRYRTALGETHLRVENYSAAYRELTAALAAGGENDFRIHRHRAISLLGLKRVREAKEANRRALRLEPDDQQALNGLGLCFLQEGMGDSARYYFQRAVGADSSKAGPYMNWMISCEIEGLHAARDSLRSILARRFGEPNFPARIGDDVKSRFVR